MNTYMVMLIEDRFKTYLEKFCEIISSNGCIYTVKTSMTFKEVSEIPCVTMVGMPKGLETICSEMEFVAKELNIKL